MTRERHQELAGVAEAVRGTLENHPTGRLAVQIERELVHFQTGQ